VFYNKKGDVVYHAAQLGIVHNIEQNSQKFFAKHSDDCISIAKHPDGVTFATGEIGARPSVYIWNSETMEEMFCLKKLLVKGVDHLSYSTDGSYLAASLMDADNSVVIFDVHNKYELVGSQKTGENITCDLAWLNDKEFFMIGMEKLSLGSVNEKTVSVSTVVIEKALLTAGIFFAGHLVTGNSSGEIQTWKGSAPVVSMGLHDGRVDTMCCTKDR
jgi:WD40 repeat protein